MRNFILGLIIFVSGVANASPMDNFIGEYESINQPKIFTQSADNCYLKEFSHGIGAKIYDDGAGDILATWALDNADLAGETWFIEENSLKNGDYFVRNHFDGDLLHATSSSVVSNPGLKWKKTGGFEIYKTLSGYHFHMTFKVEENSVTTSLCDFEVDLIKK